MAESLLPTADGDFHPFRTEHKAREEELLPGRVFLDEWKGSSLGYRIPPGVPEAR